MRSQNDNFELHDLSRETKCPFCFNVQNFTLPDTIVHSFCLVLGHSPMSGTGQYKSPELAQECGECTVKDFCNDSRGREAWAWMCTGFPAPCPGSGSTQVRLVVFIRYEEFVMAVKAEQVEEEEVWACGWNCLGRGMMPESDQILTPILDSNSDLATDFGSAHLSNPMQVAVTLHRVRRINSPCPRPCTDPTVCWLWHRLTGLLIATWG